MNVVYRVMARISKGLDFKTPARLYPDFVGLCRELQRLPLDIAKKRKLVSFLLYFVIFCLQFEVTVLFSSHELTC